MDSATVSYIVYSWSAVCLEVCGIVMAVKSMALSVMAEAPCLMTFDSACTVV